MIEGSGSIPLTNGSGSRRPKKHVYPVDPDSDPLSQHWVRPQLILLGPFWFHETEFLAIRYHLENVGEERPIVKQTEEKTTWKLKHFLVPTCEVLSGCGKLWIVLMPGCPGREDQGHPPSSGHCDQHRHTSDNFSQYFCQSRGSGFYCWQNKMALPKKKFMISKASPGACLSVKEVQEGK